MTYHIKKPSIMASVGTVYYKGSNVWDEVYENRKTYDTEADAKAEPYIYKWEGTTIVNEE